jgi:hypothetical protein
VKILVCSRVSIPAKDRTLPAWEHLRALGHVVSVCHPGQVDSGDRPDVVISMGVTIMDETFEAVNRWPDVPLYCYNWDCYEWVWQKPNYGLVQAYHPSRGKEYDYVRYGQLLRLAREVWVPSKCTGVRTEQWWGLKNWRVILSACPWWEYDDVGDDGYALCCLREIPDPYWGRLERVCKEIGIPLHMPRHELPYADYQREVARCRFLVSDLYELSTGGLSLLEGYYHGKPVLLSDSPWHGGRDYFGGRAIYFKHDDEVGLKMQLKFMHDPGRPRTTEELGEMKTWITTNFSDQRMAGEMLARIEETARGQVQE